MNHTTSTKVTHLSDEYGELRRRHKVTCSCGHLITLTDSPVAATKAAQEHTTTPECPNCEHRNRHDIIGGCSYLAIDIGTVCMCGTSTGDKMVGESGPEIVGPTGVPPC